MARIPLPERGQPLDLTYIYQLANSINEISNQLSPSVSKYSAIDGVEGPNGRQSVRTSDLKFIGGTFDSNKYILDPVNSVTEELDGSISTNP